MKNFKNLITVIFCGFFLTSGAQSGSISNEEGINELTNSLIETLNSNSIKSDFSKESIEGLEAWFGKIKKKKQKLFIDQVGAYLGQSIIKNYGGTWENKDGNWAIKLSENNYVFPFSKVGKFVTNGSEDSFYSLFEMIPLVFKLDK